MTKMSEKNAEPFYSPSPPTSKAEDGKRQVGCSKYDFSVWEIILLFLLGHFGNFTGRSPEHFPPL